jgi:hypothetical protein
MTPAALLGGGAEGVPAFWRGWLRELHMHAGPAGPPSPGR